MTKKQMQDVVPPEKRSIRNVPLPNKRRRSGAGEQQNAPASTPSNSEQKTPPVPHNRGGNGGGGDTGRPPPGDHGQSSGEPRVPRWGVWTIAVVSVIVVVFAASTFFTSATVTVTPKQTTQQISTELSAGDASNINAETISLERSAQQTVTATRTTQQETRAHGEIRIYNEWIKEGLPLVSETRFRAEPNELIYKTPHRVTVPALQGGQAGTVTTEVQAAEPGSSYNIPEGTRFTVPGLKGGEGYDRVYAEAVTAIDGGASGDEPIIDPSTKESVKEDLKKSLRERVLQKLRAQVPDSYVMYPSTVDVSFSSLSKQKVNGDTVTLSLTVTADGVMLPRRELTREVVASVMPDEPDPSSITILNLSDLTFEPASGASSSDTASVQGTLSGDATFVWSVDTDKIKEDISGVEKSQIGSVLSAYNQVQQANAKVRPFWLGSFPTNPASITIKVASPTPHKTGAGAHNATSATTGHQKP